MSALINSQFSNANNLQARPSRSKHPATPSIPLLVTATNHGNQTAMHKSKQQIPTRTAIMMLNTTRVLPTTYTPFPHTILIGKGKRCTSATGNKRLACVIEMYRNAYLAASNRQQKTDIVTDIIEMVKVSNVGPAPFVKFHGGRWYEMNESAARTKVGCMIRDALSSNYKSSTQLRVNRRRAMQQALTKAQLALTHSSAFQLSGLSGASADSRSEAVRSIPSPETQSAPTFSQTQDIIPGSSAHTSLARLVSDHDHTSDDGSHSTQTVAGREQSSQTPISPAGRAVQLLQPSAASQQAFSSQNNTVAQLPANGTGRIPKSTLHVIECDIEKAKTWACFDDAMNFHEVGDSALAMDIKNFELYNV